MSQDAGGTTTAVDSPTTTAATATVDIPAPNAEAFTTSADQAGPAAPAVTDTGPQPTAAAAAADQHEALPDTAIPVEAAPMASADRNVGLPTTDVSVPAESAPPEGTEIGNVPAALDCALPPEPLPVDSPPATPAVQAQPDSPIVVDVEDAPAPASVEQLDPPQPSATNGTSEQGPARDSESDPRGPAEPTPASIDHDNAAPDARGPEPRGSREVVPQPDHAPPDPGQGATGAPETGTPPADQGTAEQRPAEQQGPQPSEVGPTEAVRAALVNAEQAVQAAAVENGQPGRSWEIAAGSDPEAVEALRAGFSLGADGTPNRWSLPAATADPVEVTLKFVPGMDPGGFQEKSDALRALGDAGLLYKAPNPVKRGSASEDYRQNVIKAVHEQHRDTDPELSRNVIRHIAGQRKVAPPAAQPDHVWELQLGGPDAGWNMRFLHAFTNEHIGTRQIRPQIQKLPDGTPITIRIDE